MLNQIERSLGEHNRNEGSSFRQFDDVLKFNEKHAVDRFFVISKFRTGERMVIGVTARLF